MTHLLFSRHFAFVANTLYLRPRLPALPLIGWPVPEYNVIVIMNYRSSIRVSLVNIPCYSNIFFMQVDLSWKNADILCWHLRAPHDRNDQEQENQRSFDAHHTFVKNNNKDNSQDSHVRALSYKSFNITKKIRVLWIDWAPAVFLRDSRLLTMCSLMVAYKAAYQVQEGSVIFLLRCQPYHYDELQPSQLHTFPFPRQRQGICFLSIGMSSMVSK